MVIPEDDLSATFIMRLIPSHKSEFVLVEASPLCSSLQRKGIYGGPGWKIMHRSEPMRRDIRVIRVSD